MTVPAPPGPSPLDAVDALRLTPLVRSAAGRGRLDVVDWRHAPLLGGMKGSVHRFAGTGRDGAEIVPWSLVLKVLVPPAPLPDAPPVAAGARAAPVLGAYRYWKREALLAQSGVLDRLPDGWAAARCLGVEEEHGPPGGPGERIWFWLEDLADAYDHRWPLARYGLAARHLGRFNGAYLAGRALPDHPWHTTDFLREW